MHASRIAATSTSQITGSKVVQVALCAFMASIPFDLPQRSIPVDIPSITSALLLLAVFCFCSVERWTIPWAFELLMVYMGVAAISTVLSCTHPGEAVKLYLQILDPLLMFFVVYHLALDRRRFTFALWVLVGACICRAAVQVLGLATTSLGRGHTEDRLSAFGQNPNTASTNLAVGLLILLALTGRSRNAVRIWAMPALLILIITAILQMSSRGAIIALIAGLLTLFGVNRTGRPPLLVRVTSILAVILALVFMFFYSQATRARFEDAFESGRMAGREELYPDLLHMGEEKPLLGWGLVENHYELGRLENRAEYPSRDSHNLFLEVWTSTGFLGLVPFVWALCICTRAAWRALYGPDGSLPLALLVCVIVSNLSGDWLEFKTTWVVLGYALASGEFVSAEDSRFALLRHRCAGRRRASRTSGILAGDSGQ